MNIDVIKRRVLGAEATKGLFAEKYADGLSFCFSVFKLSSSATRVVRGRNIVSTGEADIGFENDVMSASEISALGSGSEVVAPIFYNQKGSYVGNLLANTAIATRPAIVDNSNQPIDFIRTRVQGEGYWTPNTVSPAPVLQNDYIISFVQKNETNPNNSRPNFYIKTSSNNLVCGAIRNFNGLNFSILTFESGNAYEFKSIAPSGFNNTFGIYTFSKINGINKIYFNGVESNLQINTTGDIAYGMDSRGGAGVGLNTRPFNLTSGKVNDFQSYILHTGNDLSNFQIQDYLNDLKAIHGIP
jgi:hypothetical protein